MSVRDLDVELVGAFQNGLSFLDANVVSNLCGVRSVVHEQHVDFLGVVNDELVEAAL